MALATRCPHCGTVFRVASDQLKLRGGIVRCGKCSEVFDGNATLIDLDAARSVPAHVDPAPRHDPPQHQRQGEPQEQSQEQAQEQTQEHTQDQPPGHEPSALEAAVPDQLPASTHRADEAPAESAAPNTGSDAAVHDADPAPASTGMGDDGAAAAAGPAHDEPSASANFDAQIAAIESGQEAAAAHAGHEVYELDFDTAFSPLGILPHVDTTHTADEDATLNEPELDLRPAGAAPTPDARDDAPADAHEGHPLAESGDDSAIPAEPDYHDDHHRFIDAPHDDAPPVAATPAGTATSDASADAQALLPEPVRSIIAADPAMQFEPEFPSPAQPPASTWQATDAALDPVIDFLPEPPPDDAPPAVDADSGAGTAADVTPEIIAETTYAPLPDNGEAHATDAHADDGAPASFGSAVDDAPQWDDDETPPPDGDQSAEEHGFATDAAHAAGPPRDERTDSPVASAEPADDAHPALAVHGDELTANEPGEAAEADDVPGASDDSAAPADAAPTHGLVSISSALALVTAEHDPDEPAFVTRVRRKEKTTRIVRVVMAIGSVLLIAGVLAQGAITFGSVLAARYPELKPELAAACTLLHCRITLPAQADVLAIDTGELQTIGGSSYSFSTVLHNSGDLTQAWPSIELALTDAGDQPLLRRVITPAQYLPPGTDPAKGFAPHAEQTIKLYFELKDIKASGYRLAVFYP